MSGTGGLGTLVLTLFNSNLADSTTSNLLSIIYGGGTGSAAGSVDPSVALKNAEANSTTDIAQEAAQPAVARDITAFRNAVDSATSPVALLQDTTVLKVLLTANGLADQVQYPALAQKALLSNTNDSTALANQLSDSQWKATASLYDFANQGLAVLQNPSVISTITNGYAEVLWRQSLNQTTPGLADALAFRDAASGITSVDQILGDPTLRNVVTTALGIPIQIAEQDLPAQEQAITSKLDITKFSDPNFVETFITRFLVASQNNASPADSQSLTQLAVSAGRGLIA